MNGSALISPCGTYRYVLQRHLPSMLRWVQPMLFIMLNPSTADAQTDDPTIRRCLGFAKREGATVLTVVNLFALRATDPATLAAHANPVGPDNGVHLIDQIGQHQRVGAIVAAWGAQPITRKHQHVAALRQLLIQSNAQCLGMTKDGSPRHPLYVKADQPLEPLR